MYLNNRDLYIEVIVSKARGKLTKNAEKMLELLAKKTIKKMRYWTNDDKLDCYQSGLLDMFQNWYNFNEEKSLQAKEDIKPFSLFSKSISETYNNISASVGNITQEKEKIEESVKKETEKQIDLIPVETEFQ